VAGLRAVRHSSLLQIHGAVFLFGLSGLFGKLVSLPPTVIVLGRVAFATLFLSAVLTDRRQGVRLRSWRDVASLAALGVILAVHWVTFFQSVQVSTVAIGLLTFSTFPVFVTFLEPVFFSEGIARSDVLLALIAVFGVGLVVPDFDISSQLTQGALWGVASGFLFAVLSILNRRFVQSYSSLSIALYQDGTAVIVLIPFLFVTKPVFSPQDIALLAFLGIVCTGIAHTMFISGLSNVKARTASIIATLEPVYGVALSAVLLGEIPTARVVLGGVIILGAAYYATLRSAPAAGGAESN
jgi:drug/metabolite transporter (DMT)-like permease